jgi:hypothetical protein
MLLSDLFHRFETKKKNRQKFLAPGFFSPFSNRTHTKENNRQDSQGISLLHQSEWWIRRRRKKLVSFLNGKTGQPRNETREKKKINVDWHLPNKGLCRLFVHSRVFSWPPLPPLSVRDPKTLKIPHRPAHTHSQSFFKDLSYARWRSIIIRGYATFQDFFSSRPENRARENNTE